MTWGDGWHDGAMGWQGWLAMSLTMLLVLAAVATVTWLIARGLRAPAPSTPPPAGDRALEELRLRLARGEIGLEEFEARRRALEGGGA